MMPYPLLASPPKTQNTDDADGGTVTVVVANKLVYSLIHACAKC